MTMPYGGAESVRLRNYSVYLGVAKTTEVNQSHLNATYDGEHIVCD